MARRLIRSRIDWPSGMDWSCGEWPCGTTILLALTLVGAILVGVAAGPAMAQNDLSEFDEIALPDVSHEAAQGSDLPLPMAEELPAGESLDQEPADSGPSATPDSPLADSSPESLPPESLPPESLSSETLPFETDRVAFPATPFDDGEDISAGQLDPVPQEIVRERYADGSVRIERGVAQDEQQNFINHGAWKNWDAEGNLIAQGTYQAGQRHGRWVRHFQGDESDLFSASPFDLFTPPFRSQADFQDDQLHGHWIITDKHERTVCDWQFSHGRRHGVSIWFYPNANKMRQIGYESGELEGELIEWDHNNEVITRVEYQGGRRLDKTTKKDTHGQRQIEGMVLHARLVLKEPDDWWNAKLATYAREGKDQKHGEWSAWYSNGQVRFTGHFVYGQPDGEFTWWYSNGQKSLNGAYENGQKSGTWTWWHETGLKSIQGFYANDSPTDIWIWWHEDGRVARRVDFSSGEPVALRPATNARAPGRTPRSR